MKEMTLISNYGFKYHLLLIYLNFTKIIKSFIYQIYIVLKVLL